jgi:hypothetical protein
MRIAPDLCASNDPHLEFHREAASAIEPCLERVKICYESASPAKGVRQ